VKFEFHAVDKKQKPVITEETGEYTAGHVNNFIDCVKSRKPANADVLIGHRSAQASHLGNIAYCRSGGSSSIRSGKRDPGESKFATAADCRIE